jgi:hypothetical protein
MKVYKHALTAILVSICCQPAWSETLKLSYECSIKESGADSRSGWKSVQSVSPESKTINKTVTMSDDALEVAAGGKTTIYDFKDKKLYLIDPAAKTYQINSLYAEIAFRDAELQNRTALSEILLKAGLDKKGKSPFDAFDVSCELGLAPDSWKEDAIICEDTVGQMTFKYDGRIVTVARLSPKELGRYRPPYEKFLVHQTHVHPFIRKSLIERGVAMEKLEYSFDSAGGVKREEQFKLSASKPGPTSIQLPQAYKRSFSGSPLAKLQEKILNAAQPPALPSAGDTVAEAKKLIAEKQPLDAMLTLVEFPLISSSPLGDEGKSLINSLKSDPDVEALSQNLDVQDSAQTEKALHELDKLKAKAPRKAYMIDLFKANLSGGLHQPPVEADILFIDALKGNPLLVGAYKDLGMFYYSRYNTTAAWECFELARAVNAQHPILRPIAKIEQHLTLSHPEFF